MKERTLKDYFPARFVRIFSVLIPALIFTFLCDKLGFYFDPDFYINTRHFNGEHSFSSLLHILIFTGEMLNSHIVFGTNEPVWSLQFEVVYYFLFGVIVFLRN